MPARKFIEISKYGMWHSASLNIFKFPEKTHIFQDLTVYEGGWVDGWVGGCMLNFTIVNLSTSSFPFSAFPAISISLLSSSCNSLYLYLRRNLSSKDLSLIWSCNTSSTVYRKEKRQVYLFVVHAGFFFHLLWVNTCGALKTFSDLFMIFTMAMFMPVYFFFNQFYTHKTIHKFKNGHKKALTKHFTQMSENMYKCMKRKLS